MTIVKLFFVFNKNKCKDDLLLLCHYKIKYVLTLLIYLNYLYIRIMHMYVSVWVCFYQKLKFAPTSHPPLLMTCPAFSWVN